MDLRKYALLLVLGIMFAALVQTARADVVYGITGLFTYCSYGPCPVTPVTFAPGSTITYNTSVVFPPSTLMATAVDIVLDDGNGNPYATYKYLPSASTGCGTGCYLNVNGSTETEWYGNNPAPDSYLILHLGVNSMLQGGANIEESGPDVAPAGWFNLDGTFQLTPLAVPEPGMLGLLGLGLFGLMAARTLRKPA
jgi:hypothetical protein